MCVSDALIGDITKEVSLITDEQFAVLKGLRAEIFFFFLIRVSCHVSHYNYC